MLAHSKNWKGRREGIGAGADRAIRGAEASRNPLNVNGPKTVGLGVSRIVTLGMSCLLLWGLESKLCAQPLPTARLNLVQPAVLRAGATVDMTIQGSELEYPAGLIFSVPGATAQLKSGNVFSVKIPEGTPPVVADVRFSGRFGVSNPRGVEITDLPVVSIPSTNTSAATAFPLALDTAVFANTSANALDHYAVRLKKGQRVVVRILTRELDSRLEPVMSVFTESGRELTRARRAFLDFTAPEEGGFVVKVQDALFRGGAESMYRLVVSTAPYVDFAMPNALRRGVTNRVTLCGRNLPGSKVGKRIGVDGRLLEELEVNVVAPALGELQGSLPRRSSVFMEPFTWTYRGSNGWSNPLIFNLADAPGVAGPTTPGATAVDVPVEYGGQFMPRGALSGVQFGAKKGEAFWLEVFADRLGLHADATAVVQRQTDAKDAQGNPTWTDVLELPELEANLGDRDFNTSSRDCAGRFEAPDNGTYRVWVRDLYNLGIASPRHPYQLTVRRETPDFRLAVAAVQPPRPKDDNREVHPITPVVRRGGTIVARVMVFRRGYGGEIELVASGLPKGIKGATGRILAGQNSGLLFLTASEDAPNWTGMIQVTGRAKVGNTVVERPARAGSVVWHLPDWDQATVSSRPAAGLPLSVLGSEVSPVVISVAAGKALEAPVGGKLTIPLLVSRRGDYPAAFNLKPYGKPELDKAKDVSVAEKATNATVEINLAELKLPEGTHWLYVSGQCAGKYRKMPELADAAEGESKKAEKDAADAAAAAKKAADELAALKDPKPEVKSAAEKRSADAAAAAKVAEERKKTAAQVAKDASERAKPRDIVVPVVSAPFAVTITPAPKAPEKK